MTIELDNLLDLREKIDDAGNLIGLQETELLHVHNAVVENHVAKTNDAESYTAMQLALAADLSGERAASLNRMTGKVLAELHTSVNDLMAESDSDEANDPESTVASLYQAMADIRDGLVKGSRRGDKPGDIIDTAIDLLNLQLADLDNDDLGASAIEEADNAQ